jgi:hypothetical protein
MDAQALVKAAISASILMLVLSLGRPLLGPGVVRRGVARVHGHGDRQVLHFELVDRFQARVGKAPSTFALSIASAAR